MNNKEKIQSVVDNKENFEYFDSNDENNNVNNENINKINVLMKDKTDLNEFENNKILKNNLNFEKYFNKY
jgi:hypothetical protein